MPYRIAIGSCSHPSLPQPLWKVIHERKPAAFIWGGDAVYSDRNVGHNWTAVGLRRVHDDESRDASWRLTFPPPSIHLDASPDVIRGQYEEQWDVDDYRNFVEGWHDAENDGKLTRPVIFGTIDDHDYGQNNGDFTYQYKNESNLAFVDFLYSGVVEDENNCAKDVIGGQDDVCDANQDKGNPNPNGETRKGNKPIQCNSCHTRGRNKSNDPMYQRVLEGKGVYGVTVLDFSRSRDSASSSQTRDDILWGGGSWVPDDQAMIDPDVISPTDSEEPPKYSTTHSVAIFALDVRSNKTPWPKGKQKHSSATAAPNLNINATTSKSSPINPPMLDFLGQHQWEWFQSALGNSRAAINIIVSGLQIHPERFPNDGNIVEEWSKFPESRQMLYDMILDSGARSPLLVSGDVHMSQFLRKDCVQSSDIIDGSKFKANVRKRSLVEITTSGMTHSWGTSFSSQPKNHRFPLKPYTYFVSRTFMTICHYIFPWNDIVIKTTDDVKREADEWSVMQEDDDQSDIPRGGRIGKQFYLGLNFADFEFAFDDQDQDDTGDGGSVTVRIFGAQAHAPPKLEMRWTFDQLSGNVDLPGVVDRQDFLHAGHPKPSTSSSQTENEWICVPYRGLASMHHEYAANIIMFFIFCFLFFLPHCAFVWLMIGARRQWSQWRNVTKHNNNSTERPGLRGNGRHLTEKAN